MAETGPESAQEERQGDPARVLAFTDGVFAIIITILVLEIGVPADLPDQGLREALDETGPTLLAWVISFLLTGMYWVWHRDLFAQVRRVNRDLVWLNLLFLLFVGLIPFASALLGEYHDEPIALVVYGVVVILVNLLRVALYAYVVRRPRLLWEPVTDRRRRIGRWLAIAPIGVYVLAMAVAVAAPTLGLLLLLSVPLLYFLLLTLLRDRASTSADVQDYT